MIGPAEKPKPSREVHADELLGIARKPRIKTDLAWGIEHAGCGVGVTWGKLKDGAVYSFFLCPRHNSIHIIKGFYKTIPT